MITRYDQQFAELESETDYVRARIIGAARENQQINHTSFMQTHLMHNQLHHISMEHCTFKYAIFDTCHMMDSTYNDSHFIDTVVTGVVVLSTDMIGTRWKKIICKDSKFVGIHFVCSQFESVVFENCIFTEVDFSGSLMKEVQFPGCTINKVSIKNTAMKKVDFRDTTQLGVLDEYRSLSGAILTPAQVIEHADALAKTLGISVIASQTMIENP